MPPFPRWKDWWREPCVAPAFPVTKLPWSWLHSGGPDSLALLFCLHRLSERHRLRLHVAHLNHNFRGEEAEEDARFVRSVAEELGLPSTVDKRHPRAGDLTRNSSFEQAARETRYAFLAEVAQNVGGPCGGGGTHRRRPGRDGAAAYPERFRRFTG